MVTDDGGTEQDGLEPTAESDLVGGRLVLAGTPLGNPLDASARLRSALESVDVIAAEDTRRLKRLARDLRITLTARVVSYYDAVELDRLPDLVAALQAQRSVLLVTDAGMPSVSDPGYRLVDACFNAGIPVTCLPGPSAVTVALALSGLRCDRFCFEGFLPRKHGERARALAVLATEQRTMVFFEAPHRLAVMLAAALEAFGPDREAAVCRELTKTYEEVRRASLGELLAWAQEGVRGEITVVISGASAQTETPTDEALAALVTERVAAGTTKKDAIAEVAGLTGAARRVVYEAFHHQ